MASLFAPDVVPGAGSSRWLSKCLNNLEAGAVLSLLRRGGNPALQFEIETSKVVAQVFELDDLGLHRFEVARHQRENVLARRHALITDRQNPANVSQ